MVQDPIGTGRPTGQTSLHGGQQGGLPQHGPLSPIPLNPIPQPKYFYKLFLQTIFTNYFIILSQTIFTNYFHKLFLQTISTQVIFTNCFYKIFLQPIFTFIL